jgi:hypothetical protein
MHVVAELQIMLWQTNNSYVLTSIPHKHIEGTADYLCQTELLS